MFAYPVDLAIPRYFDRRGHIVHERMPNLFQHMGYVSTFSGNGKERENLKSSTFQRNEANVTHAQFPVGASGFIGCFRDSADGKSALSPHPPLCELTSSTDRDLTGFFRLEGAGSPLLCAQLCKTMMYFGLQNGGQCFCGNEFGRHGKVADGMCNLKCRSACDSNCGGPLANAVYRLVWPTNMLNIRAD